MIITVEKLIELMKENNIPMNAKLTSDSGWECCATDVESVFYDSAKNEIVLCSDDPNLERRYGQNVIYSEKKEDTGFPYDYFVGTKTNIVLRGDDKRKE